MKEQDIKIEVYRPDYNIGGQQTGIHNTVAVRVTHIPTGLFSVKRQGSTNESLLNLKNSAILELSFIIKASENER